MRRSSFLFTVLFLYSNLFCMSAGHKRPCPDKPVDRPAQQRVGVQSLDEKMVVLRSGATTVEIFYGYTRDARFFERVCSCSRVEGDTVDLDLSGNITPKQLLCIGGLLHEYGKERKAAERKNRLPNMGSIFNDCIKGKSQDELDDLFRAGHYLQFHLLLFQLDAFKKVSDKVYKEYYKDGAVTASVRDCIEAGVVPDDVAHMGDCHYSPTWKTLRFSNLALASLEGLHLIKGLDRIKELDLSENPLVSLHGIEEVAYIKNLEVINLSKGWIRALRPGVFSPLSVLEKLKEISFSNNEICEVCPGAFLGLSQVEELRLDDNVITHLSRDAFEGLSSLKKLFIDDNRARSLQLEKGVFDPLKELLLLSLQNSKMHFLPYLLTCQHQLEKLFLSGNPIDRLPIGSFDGAYSLKTLDLKWCHLREIEQEALSPLVSLCTLYLQHNNLRSLPLRDLEQARDLKTISLDGNPNLASVYKVLCTVPRRW